MYGYNFHVGYQVPVRLFLYQGPIPVEMYGGSAVALVRLPID